MAERDSLENLIEGLAGAVVEAQRRIEAYQIKNFLSYFDEHNSPLGMDIKLPSMHPEKDEDAIYHVPYLPLVASSLLRIKDVEISFDTDITGLVEADDEDASDEAEGNSDVPGSGKKKSISLDLRGGGFRRKAGRAHVVLKVEGREPSEGMARLIDRLLQVQGETK